MGEEEIIEGILAKEKENSKIHIDIVRGYLKSAFQKSNTAEDYCGNERPARKILCQLKKGHKGSHRAVIFWEGEK